MLHTLAATKVADIQRRAPIRALEDTTLGEAVARMREHDRGSVFIETADGRLLGIFTQRDLVTRVSLSDDAWQRVPLVQVMTPRPRTVRDSAPLSEALRHMAEGQFRTLPVVDQDGRVTGSVSIRDLLKHIAENFPKEFLNLPPEPGLQASHRWGG